MAIISRSPIGHIPSQGFKCLPTSQTGRIFRHLKCCMVYSQENNLLHNKPEKTYMVSCTLYLPMLDLVNLLVPSVSLVVAQFLVSLCIIR